MGPQCHLLAIVSLAGRASNRLDLANMKSLLRFQFRIKESGFSLRGQAWRIRAALQVFQHHGFFESSSLDVLTRTPVPPRQWPRS